MQLTDYQAKYYAYELTRRASSDSWVACSAFRGAKSGYPNLTVKRIPNAVLSRCEWGHDDYSLKVENLPQAPPVFGQQSLFAEWAE